MKDDFNVLVLEDDEPTQFLLKKVLERDGMTVLPASYWEDAKEYCERIRFNAAMIDLKLKDISGEELVLSVARFFKGRQMPVLFMSADVSDGIRSTIEKMGFDGVIEKPLLIETIPAQLRELSRKERKPIGHGVDMCDLRSVEISTEERAAQIEGIRREINHDLKTPLAVVISYLTTLRAGRVAEINSEGIKLLDVAIAQCYTMSDIISAIVKKMERMKNEIVEQEEGEG